MKKYSNYLKTELIEVIKQKNETINKLNGKVYYYKKTAEYYKKKYKEQKNDIRCWNAKLQFKSQWTNGFGRGLFKGTSHRKNLSLLIDDDLKPSDIERITLDLTEQIDEFGLLTYDGDYVNQIEVVTKEQAKKTIN